MDVKIGLPDGTSLKTKSRNISFGGILIEAENINFSELDDKFDLSLLLLKGKDRISIGFHCKTIHYSQTALGLKFLAIDAKSYEPFKQLITTNSPNSEKLMGELERYPGILFEDPLNN